jgi:multidrug efflux pump
VNLSRPFIERPIGTTLLTIALALVGAVAFFALPVAPLPQVDYPAISVNASLPGASPATIASSVASPLERRLGAIPGVNEVTSSSRNGTARVSLQFELNRKIDAAAREVQAAINAARADLPLSLRANPSYSKSNPADTPVIVLALTSATRSPGQIYEAVANLVQQKLSQVKGVGEVELGGGSLPAVRVQLQPFALNRYGIAMEDVRAAIQASAANRPKGQIEQGAQRYQIYTDTGVTVLSAAAYRELVLAWRNGAPVRLSDVAEVIDSVEDKNTLGLFNGAPAVIVLVNRQPGANVIETVDAVKDLLPELRAELPQDITMQVSSDRTYSIRASLNEIEITLLISLVLVVLVVSAFLRSVRATVIPAVATIVSLLGTFAVMYALGFSLNNLSLMALTVATGFVVDDAIVVLENISRHLESGMDRFQAALTGAREVGFTVVSISVSLVAVFIPLLFMGGQVGRLFREFAVTLSAAVMISLLVSLTTTPMMCAWLLRRQGEQDAQRPPGRVARAVRHWLARGYARIESTYAASLDAALAHRWLVLLSLAAVVALNGWLFTVIPKGFFPQQDSGLLSVGLRADQSISFQAMRGKLQQLVDIIRKDPAVDTVVGFTGGSRPGGGYLFITLKPWGVRTEKGQDVVNRLRPKLSRVTGVGVFLSPVQDLRMGTRRDANTLQYTLKSDSLADLKTWSDKLAQALKGRPELVDIDNDLQQNGVEAFVRIDRDAIARLGVSMRDVNNALYNAFGQRQVATLYGDLNQYHVILGVSPEHAQSPQALNDIYVPARAGAALVASSSTVGGANSGSGTVPSPNPGTRDPASGQVISTTPTTMVPLSAFASFSERATAAIVSHQDAELAATVSFALAKGRSMSDAQLAVREAEAAIAMPANVRGSFQGTARAYQESQGQQPLLILLAIVTIYIVLGILYESLIHPITVLSTIPSAGVGAVIALMLFDMEFSIIALIGVFLLLGIVKKNAILIIDVALELERSRGLSALDAIREASIQRLRPILMTTAAAALGALPLAIGFGEGSELRQPLGVTIIGGLVASQLLTLLTTPVVYVALDRWRRRSPGDKALARHSEYDKRYDNEDSGKGPNAGVPPAPQTP